MTNAILIPLQVYQLLAWRGDVLLPKNWGPFSLAVTGGFLSEQKTAQLLSDVTDNLEFVFGMTELNPSPLRTRVTSPEDRLWFEAVEGRSVEIVDEYDNSCAPGQEGILRVRICDQDFHGYMDDPEATAKFFRDGYFYPGDLAISRSDGRLQPLGRNLDVINVGGHKVPCAPLERELQKMLKVDAVCLFTGVDNAGQQEIVVALKTDEVPAEPDLGRVSHKLRIFDKVRFEFERDFPTTRTGMQKVDRVALRKLLFPDNQADNN